MMEQTASLTNQEWNIAHAIARDLIVSETDPNEVKKILEYLRKFQSKNFFEYLKTFATKGNKIGHSGRTIEYYRNIETACKNYLIDYQDQKQQ